MAGSLFDQLKKTGLIDKQKAKQAKKNKYQQSKQNKGKKGSKVISVAEKLAVEATQKKLEHDRQLSLERQQAQAKKAQQAELLQVINSNRLKSYEGEDTYHFSDDNKVKSLKVSSKVKQQLISGRVRIVRFEGSYILISDNSVDKIEQRDKHVLIPLAVEKDLIADKDKDYYAQFEIPDDLVW